MEQEEIKETTEETPIVETVEESTEAVAPEAE